MIEIRISDGKNAAVALMKSGLTTNSGMLVYEAVEGSKTLGYCIFSISGGEGRIYSVSMCSEGLSAVADGLLRSALSLMCKRGAKDAVCGGGIDKALLLNTGFRHTGGQWMLSIGESFFAGCIGDK